METGRWTILKRNVMVREKFRRFLVFKQLGSQLLSLDMTFSALFHLFPVVAWDLCAYLADQCPVNSPDHRK